MPEACGIDGFARDTAAARTIEQTDNLPVRFIFTEVTPCRSSIVLVFSPRFIRSLQPDHALDEFPPQRCRTYDGLHVNFEEHFGDEGVDVFVEAG
jgi:hypothetical protein